MARKACQGKRYQMEAWGKKRVKRIVYAEKSITRILGINID
ncbi:hypothetical protein HanPI659440_Chr02g0086351 [Helianthus annuus]|nr:hypothetical protein HanPI659440_Chr02g0086351 [Helianthus annuus]